jgi:hypothetical protein
MMKYVSEKTDISLKKQIKVQWVKKPGKKLRFPAQNIIVVDKEGKQHPYMIDSRWEPWGESKLYVHGTIRYDKAGIVADHFLVEVYRDVEEFNYPVVPAGKYKDSYTVSDGGGYCMVPKFRVDDKFFAMLDCKCF